MRVLFGVGGRVDGWENTSANADGALERIIGAIEPGAAEPMRVVTTRLGEISLFIFRTPSPG